MPDQHANFAYSTVAAAPAPALSGTSLTVAAGDGAKFPAAPFNAPVWPANAIPLASNAEIVRVTVKVGDVFTIVRTTTTESPASGNRAIVVGDQISCPITKKTLLDIEYDTVISPTDTGTLNNYNPGLSGHTLVLLGNATLAEISGFAGGITGQRVTVMSTGAGQINFLHNDAGSTQKLSNTATSGKTSVAPNSGGVAQFYFDGTLWRLKQHDQGAWITPSAPTWTPNVAGTFATTTIFSLKYILRGRIVYLDVTVSGTNSNAGNTAFALNNTGFGGFSVVGNIIMPAMIADAGTHLAGFAQATGTTVSFAKFNSVTFSTGAGAVSLFGGNVFFEVS